MSHISRPFFWGGDVLFASENNFSKTICRFFPVFLYTLKVHRSAKFMGGGGVFRTQSPGLEHLTARTYKQTAIKPICKIRPKYSVS